MFPCCVDIHGIVSPHVETVVLLSKEKYADALKKYDGIAAGFVDGDLEILYKK